MCPSEGLGDRAALLEVARSDAQEVCGCEGRCRNVLIDRFIVAPYACALFTGVVLYHLKKRRVKGSASVSVLSDSSKDLRAQYRVRSCLGEPFCPLVLTLSSISGSTFLPLSFFFRQMSAPISTRKVFFISPYEFHLSNSSPTSSKLMPRPFVMMPHASLIADIMPCSMPLWIILQ